MKIFQFTLYLLIFLFLISSKLHSQEPYVITSESLEIIPNEHLRFLEGFDETVSFEILESAEWSDRRLDAQSMVDGYWVRFVVKNNLKTDKIGLSHNFNYEKKIFIKNSLGIDEFSYWKLGLEKHRGEDHIGGAYQLKIPTNELTFIYDFFRNNPVDRFNSKDNYHRMMIGTWESLENKEFYRLIGNVAFIAPTFLFGVYYFFVYLISRGNYLWISLTLLLLSLISTINFFKNQIGYYILGPAISSTSGLVFFVPLIFLLLIQFFRKTLDLKIKYPIFNKIYIVVIIFYSLASIFNFFDLIYWPNEDLINLVKHPPDNLGPGIIKLHFIMIPFFILLLIAIIISFVSWRSGSSPSGYLYLSFLFPFSLIPIALTLFIYLGGFNDFFGY